MRIDKLKLHERNPRQITQAALNKLAESIRRDPEFMVLRPIVVDKDGTVLGGNMRLRAIRQLGMDEVPDAWVVRAADLTDEQKRRFILVDNAPTGMAGTWDIDLLANEWDVPELEELGFDLGELGLEADFAPGTLEDQGKLDELQPKIVKCPSCGVEFDARES